MLTQDLLTGNERCNAVDDGRALPCICCNKPFAFDPVHVPSVCVEGVEHPICRTCVEYFNVLRITNGVDPIAVGPDAYPPFAESSASYEVTICRPASRR